jgi:hypothetical protein
MYWSIIRPIVTYACEAWVLTETVKNKLIIFERKVLRKILGPTKERGSPWRIKTNDELDKLIRHKNIINHIKAQAGLTIYIECQKNGKKVYKWKPMLKRPLGRPKNRWEDDIRNHMKKLKIKNWISCIQVRNKWKSVRLTEFTE